MSNIKTGTKFEHDFCILASKEGFWAHMLNANKNALIWKVQYDWMTDFLQEILDMEEKT